MFQSKVGLEALRLTKHEADNIFTVIYEVDSPDSIFPPAVTVRPLLGDTQETHEQI
jgi:hypothetical protein